jgi:NADH dehydrogenase [ubiquinone] 1 alpha subcomplex assembly factor 7
MARANAAYYANHDPFADFTTAPEIAQMFGELLGAWAAVTWESMGSPDPVQLIEAGPGRGTLMQDARRATARVAPEFHAACRVHLIDFSPRLRAEQAARVPDATWHDALETVPAGPAIVFANEFLDALPIRQFVRAGQGWHERHVEGGCFADLPAEPPVCGADGDMPLAALADATDVAGAILETSPACRAWIATLARRLVQDGGAALIMDYGTAQTGYGDSLQALRLGVPADPLGDPGHADLTAHVDFAALARAAVACGAACHGPVPQGSFLHAIGLTVRTTRLIAANPDRAGELREAASRLAAPDRMGVLFKALCVTQPGLGKPAGFG